MTYPANTFTAGAGFATELGSQIAQGGLVQLKNLGPSVVFLRPWFAGNTDSVAAANVADNGQPLAPGDEVTVRVPPYPIAQDTHVPAVTAVSGNATLAYIVTGE